MLEAAGIEAIKKIGERAVAGSSDVAMQNEMARQLAQTEAFRVGELHSGELKEPGLLKQREANAATDIREALGPSNALSASEGIQDTANLHDLNAPASSNIEGTLRDSIIEQTENVAESDFTTSFSEPGRLLPRNDGQWDGEPGNSRWTPNRDCSPLRDNPNGVSWAEILDQNKIRGVQFANGEPVFSDFADATVQIDDFSISRIDNFTQADEKLAAEWTSEQKGSRDWMPEDVNRYRHENRLTWHERSDMRTVDLVSRDVHGNISHTGGISAIKNI